MLLYFFCELQCVCVTRLEMVAHIRTTHWRRQSLWIVVGFRLIRHLLRCVYVYMCVCVCVCIYIYIYSLTFSHTHARTRAHTHTHTEGYPEIKDTRLLHSFNWEVSDHPAHSPDLAASEFHLFLHLKKHLAARSFTKTKKWKTPESLRGCVRRRQSTITSEYKNLYPD
jgi:hypothetical protein